MSSKVTPSSNDIDQMEAAPADAAEDGQPSAAAKRSAAVRAMRRRERRLAVATVILYMLSGFVFYSFIAPQHKDTANGGTTPWTFVDCIYFAVTTTTTVGYGDLVPKDAGAKIFTIVFAFVAVGLVGLAMGMIAQS